MVKFQLVTTFLKYEYDIIELGFWDKQDINKIKINHSTEFTKLVVQSDLLCPSYLFMHIKMSSVRAFTTPPLLHVVSLFYILFLNIIHLLL